MRCDVGLQLAWRLRRKDTKCRKQPKGTYRESLRAATNHSEIDDWFRRQMPHLQPIIKQLDETIRTTIPDLNYAVKWKRPFYGLAELGWIIEIAAYDVSVNVVFLRGRTSTGHRHSGLQTGPGTSRLLPLRSCSDRNCVSGSRRRAARRVGSERRPSARIQRGHAAPVRSGLDRASSRTLTTASNGLGY